MDITIARGNNYVMGNIPIRSSLYELNNWTEFIREILKYSLQGKKIYVFTLSPQKNSLGYELGSFHESKIGKEKVLINFFEKATDNLIFEIAKSEEFTRGLLKLILTDKQKSFNDLNFVTGDYTHLNDELITLEDDGISFYWYNPLLPKDQIEKKMRELDKIR